MQYSAESQPDGSATVLQPGFLASVFRDLGEERIPEQPGPADEQTAAHSRAAALAHHRTLTVQAEHQRLADLLRRAALPVSAMDYDSQLLSYEPRPYPEGEPAAPVVEAEPQWADYAPAEPPVEPDQSAGRRLLDSGYQRELAQARLRHQRELRQWRVRQAEAADSGAVAARAAHEQSEVSRARAIQEYNETLRECRRAYEQAEPAAVESLLERALAAAESATQDLPAPCRAVFRLLTRTAVLDLDLPALEVVPTLESYRLRPDGEAEPVPRPSADLAADYLRLVARLALRALQAADAVDTDSILTGVVLNGWLKDAGTGEPYCLLSVDADRDALARTRLVPAEPEQPAGDDGVYLDVEQDEALLRLRELNAAVTPDPYARAVVEPYARVRGAVPLLPDLSPNEFSHLIRELLTRGGLAEWSVRLRGPAGLVATGDGAEGSALPGRWVVWASRGVAPVGEEEVRTLADAVREEGVDHGLRLTSGRFTEAALDAAGDGQLSRIHLIDCDGLRELAQTHLGMPLAVSE